MIQKTRPSVAGRSCSAPHSGLGGRGPFVPDGRSIPSGGLDLTERGTSHTLGAMTSARDDHQSAGDEPVRTTFYEAVGGEETFTRLVRRFYERVAEDPVL